MIQTDKIQSDFDNGIFENENNDFIYSIKLNHYDDETTYVKNYEIIEGDIKVVSSFIEGTTGYPEIINYDEIKYISVIFHRIVQWIFNNRKSKNLLDLLFWKFLFVMKIDDLPKVNEEFIFDRLTSDKFIINFNYKEFGKSLAQEIRAVILNVKSPSRSNGGLDSIVIEHIFQEIEKTCNGSVGLNHKQAEISFFDEKHATSLIEQIDVSGKKPDFLMLYRPEFAIIGSHKIISGFGGAQDNQILEALSIHKINKEELKNALGVNAVFSTTILDGVLADSFNNKYYKEWKRNRRNDEFASNGILLSHILDYYK